MSRSGTPVIALTPADDVVGAVAAIDDFRAETVLARLIDDLRL